MINIDDTQEVIEKCFTAMEKSSREKLDELEAQKIAGLCLSAQMKISFFLEDVELAAKEAKNNIMRIEGEKYFEYKEKKDPNSDNKKTENMLTNYVAKHPEVVAAKLECSKQEATLKKYNYILAVLKDSHVYFRNLAKKNHWEN